MKNFVAILIVSMLTVATAFAEDSQWTLEADGGYAFGFGTGYSVPTIVFDSTFTTASEKYVGLGNYGWEIDGKVGYRLTSDLGLVLGASYLFGDSSYKSTQMVSSTPFATDNKTTWSSLQFSAGLRYTFLQLDSWSFFGGAGPLVVIPSDLKTEFSSSSPSATGTNTLSFNPGIGAYGELGTEYKLNDTFGIGVTLAFEKVSVTLLKDVVTLMDGTSLTTNYVDNPTVDQYQQTPADAAHNSTDPLHPTITQPTQYIDLSDFGLKIGIVGHF